MSRPIIPLGSHPVEAGGYTIGTFAIERAYEAILEWVRLRVPGAMITAPSRYGKSNAILYWITLLTKDFPTLLFYSLDCIGMQERSVSDSQFYEWMLESVGHEFPDAGTAGRKRRRLIEFLCEKLSTSWQGRMVIIFDEAQKLHPAHYDWLMDISNALEKRKYKMTVILVGQIELEYQRSAFINSKKIQLLARFMVQSIRFHGIRTAEEMALCLRAYDDVDAAEYPENSGYSYARYYFPKAFDDGWRIESLNRRLWQAFDEMIGDIPRDMNTEIPMACFTMVVENLLVTFQDTNPSESITEDVLKQLVIKSGMREMVGVFSGIEYA